MTSRSAYPSHVKLPVEPPEGVATVYDFFCLRFPRIAPKIWKARFAEGKVSVGAEAISRDMAFVPGLRVAYFREVSREPPVSEDFEILFEDGEILVADKPRGLPVVPAGPFVRSTLVHLLRERTENAALVPLHRLDAATAGLVLFSKRPETRGLFGKLFEKGLIRKEYRAVVRVSARSPQYDFCVGNHIERGEPFFKMKIAPHKKPNARTECRFLGESDGRALFQVIPVSGKKHQIRLHLSSVGCPILYDKLYGNSDDRLSEASPQLQLLAYRLEFRDPLSGKQRSFRSKEKLFAMRGYPVGRRS